MEQYLKQGLVPDSKVLDIRQVDVSTGRFLEDNTPVYVITFTTQEVLLFRDRKTRDVVIGAEDRVEQCNYAAVVTRVEEELENELTGGWKVIEVRIIFRRARMGLMVMSGSRWRVVRVVHIYNPAYSLMVASTTVDGRRHQPHSLWFTSTPKKLHIVPRIAHCFVASTHVTLSSTSSHHHHSGNMYTHILIHRYYHNRSSALQR